MFSGVYLISLVSRLKIYGLLKTHIHTHHTYMYMYKQTYTQRKIVTNMINFATKYIFKTSVHVKEPNTSSGCLSKCMYTCTTAKMFDDNIMHVLYYAHMEVHIIYIVS